MLPSKSAIFLKRDGLQPLDLEVGQWLRKHASGIHTLVAMNKSESLDEHGVLTAAAGEAHKLGFGDPVAISAETGLGMAELYEVLRPLFEEYMSQLPNSKFAAVYSVALLIICLFLFFSNQPLVFLWPKFGVYLSFYLLKKLYTLIFLPL